MAISTYRTYLMYKKSDSYEKLVDITSFPDLGQDPETIDVTTLTDRMRKFIAGIEGNDALTFDSFYTKEVYTKLAALKGKQTDLGVWFGGTGEDTAATPTGDLGKFNFTGEVFVRVAGAGVNEAVRMNITVVPSTAIEFVAE